LTKNRKAILLFTRNTLIPLLNAILIMLTNQSNLKSLIVHPIKVFGL